MREITFQCEDKKEAWVGIMQIKEESENHILVEAEARGTSFTIALSCYFRGYGADEWCLCVPNMNFGCQISGVSPEWNQNQFKRYIKNRVDRISLSEAVWILLNNR